MFESRVRTHAERDAAIAALKVDHPQLWAEAVVAYKAGEKWCLDAAEEALAGIEQEARRAKHPWEELILDFVADEPWVRVQDIMQNLEIPKERQSEFTLNRIASCLERAGWTKAEGLRPERDQGQLVGCSDTLRPNRAGCQRGCRRRKSQQIQWLL